MRTCIRISFFAVILVGFLPACADAKTDPDARFYSFTVEPAAITAGAETRVTVTVVPADGYKWNDEYPARFVVSAGAGVTLGKTEFKAKRKDIVPKGGKAAFTIPVTAAKAGAQALTLKGGFSVCNKTSCKIFRMKTIDLKFDVD